MLIRVLSQPHCARGGKQFALFVIRAVRVVQDSAEFATSGSFGSAVHKTGNYNHEIARVIGTPMSLFMIKVFANASARSGEYCSSLLIAIEAIAFTVPKHLQGLAL
jgi:hypothetical protein